MDDLKAWHDRTIGGKLIVGVSGDFDPVAMEARLRAAFEALPQIMPAPKVEAEMFNPPNHTAVPLDKPNDAVFKLKIPMP